MRKNIFTVILLGATITGFAQAEMSAFTSTGKAGVATVFATDYQAIGINPSNLGWDPQYEGKRGTYGMGEFSFSAYSEALTKPVFRDIFSNFNQGDVFTHADKVAAAQAFTDTELAMNLDVMTFGFSYRPNEKVGGFAFSMRERIQWYSTFNQQVSELLFLGYNSDYFDLKFNVDTAILGDIPMDTTGMAEPDFAELVKKGIATPENRKMFSEVFAGSKLSVSWFREINLSYGRPIIYGEKVKIFGGIGVKYLMGVAMADIKVEDGEFIATSSTSPGLGIDYGAAANTKNIKEVKSWFPEPVGKGFGIDLGVSVKLGEKLTFGAAVNDIGGITWEGNVYRSDDDTLISLENEGMNNYNILNGASGLIGDNSMMEWKGGESISVSLPTGLRLGGKYQVVEQLEVGAEFVIPANDAAGSYQYALMAYGAELTILKIFKISTGYSKGGNYGQNIPIGLTVVTGGGSYEFGVASRDAITFFTDNRPNLSLSMGFMRFRF